MDVDQPRADLGQIGAHPFCSHAGLSLHPLGGGVGAGENGGGLFTQVAKQLGTVQGGLRHRGGSPDGLPGAGEFTFEGGDAGITLGDLARNAGQEPVNLLPHVAAHDDGKLLAGDFVRVRPSPPQALCK